MNLTQMLKLDAGGPGSGCRGDRCGRPRVGNDPGASSRLNPFGSEYGQVIPALVPLMYHGTASSLMEKIKKEGFIAGKGKGADAWSKEHWGASPPSARARVKCIYMSPSEGAAKLFAAAAVDENPGSQPVIAKIQLPDEAITKLKGDPQSPPGQAVKYPGRIPPEWIKGWITGPEAVAPQKFGSHMGDSPLVESGAGLVYAVFLADGKP